MLATSIHVWWSMEVRVTWDCPWLSHKKDNIHPATISHNMRRKSFCWICGSISDWPSLDRRWAYVLSAGLPIAFTGRAVQAACCRWWGGSIDGGRADAFVLSVFELMSCQLYLDLLFVPNVPKLYKEISEGFRENWGRHLSTLLQFLGVISLQLWEFWETHISITSIVDSKVRFRSWMFSWMFSLLKSWYPT